MNTITREEAIDILVGNEIFDEKDINNHEKATEFYIKHLMEGFDICDIDRMAHLNTLFGYDIGVDNWSKFDSELWGNEIYWDKYGCGVEILELTYKDIPSGTTYLDLNSAVNSGIYGFAKSNGKLISSNIK